MQEDILNYVAENQPTTCNETCKALANDEYGKWDYWQVFVALKREGKLLNSAADRFKVAEEVEV